jgi:hypothetical protein
MPIDVDGGLISLGGAGRGVMAQVYCASPAIQASVWMTMRTPSNAESADIRRTLRAFWSRSC